MEAGREHVEEDAANEFRRGQRHGLLARGAGVAVIGVAEAHLFLVETQQPLVRDGDPMGVAADVVEHLRGAGKRGLGIDDPLGLVGGVEMLGEARSIGEGLERP